MNSTADIPDASNKMQRSGSKKTRRLQWAIRDERVTQWITRADLARISGQEGAYLELLERAGVDSVPELAGCDAAVLLATLRELNDDKQSALALPSEAQIERWIEQARTMTTVNETTFND